MIDEASDKLSVVTAAYMRYLWCRILLSTCAGRPCEFDLTHRRAKILEQSNETRYDARADILRELRQIGKHFGARSLPLSFETVRTSVRVNRHLSVT